MRSFLAKHQYLVIWIASIIIIGALLILVVQLNSSFLPTISSLSQPSAPAQSAPATPPQPSVTLTIQKNGKQNTLMIQWQNLPNGTTELYIFRGKGNNTSTWELWKTLMLGEGQFTNGSAQFTLGSGDLGYGYYVQAAGGYENSTGTQILWQSGSGDPGSGDNGGGNGGNQGGNGNEGGNSSSSQGAPGGDSTSTGSGNGDGQGSGGNGNGGGSGGGNSSGSNGNPYYNPQIQITGYGTANGSFWVQHVNQSIEIGWQDLPEGIDTIVVSRSEQQAGPWDQILSQKNPSQSGSYSLQLVDGTLGDPYYYEMTALEGTTTIGTYGPIYLPPTGQ